MKTQKYEVYANEKREAVVSSLKSAISKTVELVRNLASKNEARYTLVSEGCEPGENGLQNAIRVFRNFTTGELVTFKIKRK